MSRAEDPRSCKWIEHLLKLAFRTWKTLNMRSFFLILSSLDRRTMTRWIKNEKCSPEKKWSHLIGLSRYQLSLYTVPGQKILSVWSIVAFFETWFNFFVHSRVSTCIFFNFRVGVETPLAWSQKSDMIYETITKIRTSDTYLHTIFDSFLFRIFKIKILLFFALKNKQICRSVLFNDIITLLINNQIRDKKSQHSDWETLWHTIEERLWDPCLRQVAFKCSIGSRWTRVPLINTPKVPRRLPSFLLRMTNVCGWCHCGLSPKTLLGVISDTFPLALIWLPYHECQLFLERKSHRSDTWMCVLWLCPNDPSTFKEQVRNL